MKAEPRQTGRAAGTDERLTRSIAAGDESALREVIATHGPLLLGLARRVLGDAGLAEEVVQDVFVTLWRHPERFDPERGSLRTFLSAVTRNKATDSVRREESRRRTARELLRGAEIETVDPSAVAELNLYLQWVLAKLTKVQREALTLAYFGGRTYREVAQELRIPEGTAKTRLRDALTAIRRELAAAGATAAG